MELGPHAPTKVLKRRWRPSPLLLGGFWLAGAVLGGCREDKPYSPFRVTSSLPTEPPAPPTEAGQPEAALEPPAPPPALTLRPTGLPARWRAFDRELVAPKGTGFAGAVELESTLIAWVLPHADESGKAPDATHIDKARRSSGAYVVGDSGRVDRKLAEIPDFLPTGVGCQLSLAELSGRTGRVVARVQATCQSRLLPGTPTGAFLVLDPSVERPVLLLRTSEPSPGETLGLDATFDDLDADGRPDVSVAVALRAPSGSTATHSIGFLTRATGLSRLADSPGQEIEAQAKKLATAILRKKEREAALGDIDALRRFVLEICQEAGGRVLADERGRALSCGSVKGALDRLTGAAIEAYLFRDEWWKAFGEYARAHHFLGEPSRAERSAWASLLARKTRVRILTRAASVPLAVGLNVPYPYASPLRFDASGRLFALSASGDVVLLDPPPPGPNVPTDPESATPPAPLDASEVPAQQPSPGPWPLRPRSRDGRLLSAVVPSCDRAEIQLAFGGEPSEARPSNPPQSSPLQSAVLSLLAPRPCKGLSTTPLVAEPIIWNGDSLVLIAAGEPVVSSGHLEPPKPGHQSGLAWPITQGSSTEGIAVWTPRGFAWWKGPEAAGAHHCVVYSGDDPSDSDERVACVVRNQAVTFRAAP